MPQTLARGRVERSLDAVALAVLVAGITARSTTLSLAQGPSERNERFRPIAELRAGQTSGEPSAAPIAAWPNYLARSCAPSVRTYAETRLYFSPQVRHPRGPRVQVTYPAVPGVPTLLTPERAMVAGIGAFGALFAAGWAVSKVYKRKSGPL